MNLFSYLIVAHLFGDYLFQTEYEALEKAKGSFWNRALWQHCIKYTLCFAPIVWWFTLDWWWLPVILVTHLFFDRRWPIVWWRRNITRNSKQGIEATFWLTVVVDQIFHVIVLALLASLS